MVATIRAHVADDDNLICFPSDAVFESLLTDEFPRDVNHLVVMVDSSSSMLEYWPHVACCVNQTVAAHDNAHVIKFANKGVVRIMPLLRNIEQCTKIERRKGYSIGFGTNITTAFVTLAQFVSTTLYHPTSAQACPRFTVVFISDGSGIVDGLNEQLQHISDDLSRFGARFEITFIACGTDFPTTLAARIRNGLHNGRVSMPLVSVANKPSEFRHKLSALTKYFAWSPDRVRVLSTPGVRSLMWNMPENFIESGATFSVPRTVSRMALANETQCDFDIIVEPWNEDDLILLARQYLWALQSWHICPSVDNANDHAKTIRERAILALNIVIRASSQLSDENLRVWSGSAEYRNNESKEVNSVHLLDVLVEELCFIASGERFDDAPNIGLVEQPSLRAPRRQNAKRKGISDFTNRLTNFIELLKNETMLAKIKKIERVEIVSGIRCAVSLETNINVLTEPELIDTLSTAVSPLHVVRALPVCGLAIRVSRNYSARTNPWLVQVSRTVPHAPVLSTASLLSLDGDGYVACVNVGMNDMFLVNSVCALVANTEHANAMRPFLTSPLYQLLHMYCACGNLDTVDSTAHQALLAAVVCYMLDLKNRCKSMTSWMESVLMTLRELYAQELGLNKVGYSAALIETPNTAVALVSPNDASNSTTCECISKPIAAALAWDAEITTDSAVREEVLERITAEWVGRAIGRRRNIQDWFVLRNPNLLTALSKEQASSKNPLFEKASQNKQSSRYRIEYLVEEMKNCLSDGAVSYITLVQFGRQFLRDENWEIGIKDLFCYTVHAIEHCTSKNRTGPIVSFDTAYNYVETKLSELAKSAMREKK